MPGAGHSCVNVQRPAGLLEEQAAEDRLHDAGFLVEGFLDEKGVVFNLPGAR